jgi:hypothetical protein
MQVKSELWKKVTCSSSFALAQLRQIKAISFLMICFVVVGLLMMVCHSV